MVKNYHPFSTFTTTNRLKVGEGKLPDQEKFDLCKQHLIDKAADDYCVNRKTNKNLKCSCLKILRDNEDAILGVAIYMFDYHTKRTPEERARIVVDWCRYARDPNDEEDQLNFSMFPSMRMRMMNGGRSLGSTKYVRQHLAQFLTLEQTNGQRTKNMSSTTLCHDMEARGRKVQRHVHLTPL